RVVAALAAVLLGHRQAEEPELAHAREDPVLEGLLLPLLRVRGELLHDERVDRLAEALVLVGEDEVRAPRAVVGLEDGLGGAHGFATLARLFGWRPARCACPGAWARGRQRRGG